MVVLLFLLALAMIAMGGTAIYFGAPIIQVERGWSMVIAGSGVASAGAVLLGIGVAAQRMRRVEKEIRRLGERWSRGGDSSSAEASRDRPAADPARAAPAESLSARQPPVPEVAEALAAPHPVSGAPGAAPGAVVVGRYASGGNSYVMYSDGAIHADTPSGRHRFGSLDELKSFVAAGGERGGSGR